MTICAESKLSPCPARKSGLFKPLSLNKFFIPKFSTICRATITTHTKLKTTYQPDQSILLYDAWTWYFSCPKATLKKWIPSKPKKRQEAPFFSLFSQAENSPQNNTSKRILPAELQNQRLHFKKNVLKMFPSFKKILPPNLSKSNAKRQRRLFSAAPGGFFGNPGGGEFFY